MHPPSLTPQPQTQARWGKNEANEGTRAATGTCANEGGTKGTHCTHKCLKSGNALGRVAELLISSLRHNHHVPAMKKASAHAMLHKVAHASRPIRTRLHAFSRKARTKPCQHPLPHKGPVQGNCYFHTRPAQRSVQGVFSQGPRHPCPTQGDNPPGIEIKPCTRPLWLQAARPKT